MFKVVLIVLLVCVILLAVFSVQNTGPMNIQFFNILLSGAPVYSVVVASAALGALITALVAVWWRVKVGLRIRSAQRQIRDYEKATADLISKTEALLAERDQLASNVDQLTSERDGLRSRNAELEKELSLAKGETLPLESGPRQETASAEPEEQPAKPILEEPTKQQPRGLLPWR